MDDNSNIKNIVFLYAIKKENILNEIIKMEINFSENEEKKKLAFQVEKVDEIIYNDLLIKVNLFKIDKKIESNKIDITIIIEFIGNKLSVSKQIKILNENIFIFDIKFFNKNFSKIDLIEEYNKFSDYLETKKLNSMKSILRTYFIDLLSKNLDIDSNILYNILIESLKNEEFENIIQIFFKSENFSFIETKNEGIEELNNLLIELLKNNNFINKIQNDLNNQKIYININILLSITYVKLKEFEKFYQIIYNLNVEQIEIFLKKIEKRNIFHILNIKDLFNILRNINSNNKSIKIPTSIFEYLISLLKDNKEKIKLIFHQKNDLYIYLNDDLKKRNHPLQENNKPIPDVKENSIDIEKILNFNEISKENEGNMLLFLRNIEKYYFKSFKNEKFLRYIFYFNIGSILNSIYEITKSYKNLLLLKIILNDMDIYFNSDDNEDENNMFDVKKLIEDCESKIMQVIIDTINNQNLSPENYFKKINYFINPKIENKDNNKSQNDNDENDIENNNEDENENDTGNIKENLEKIILKNKNNFSEMINSINLSFFINLDPFFKNLIFKIFEGNLINFIRHKLNNFSDFTIINNFYEFIYLGLNDSTNFNPIAQLFETNINDILKNFDSSNQFTDNSIFKLILHLIQFYNNNHQMNIFLNVPLTVIINLILFYKEQNQENLDSYFEQIVKKIVNNYNLNKDNGIIICIDFIINKEKISKLNINKQNLIKTILKFITLEPISDQNFFENYFTPKESLYLDLRKLKIIENKQLYINNKFINESNQYLENMKEIITNKTIIISQFLKFGNFLNEIFNAKIILIYGEFELEKEKQNIIQILNKINTIQSLIFNCEVILRNYNLQFPKIIQTLIKLKTSFFYENEVKEIYDKEFEEKYNIIKNFYDQNKELLDYSSSLVFIKIYEEIMNNQNLNIDDYEKSDFKEKTLKKYKDLYNNLQNNDKNITINEIEKYFKNIDIEIEKEIVIKNFIITENVEEIFNSINVILSKSQNLNKIEKFINFFSIFEIQENNFLNYLLKLKDDLNKIVTFENAKEIRNNLSRSYLLETEEFDIFVNSLINLNDLFKIIKQYSIDTFKEFFNYSTDTGLLVQNIESLIFIKSMLNEIFEIKFKNENDFFDYIKNKFFINKENRKIIEKCIILNSQCSNIEKLAKKITNKTFSDKIHINSFLKDSCLNLEYKKIKNEDEDYYEIHNIKIKNEDLILNENDLFTIWEGTLLIINNLENKKTSILISISNDEFLLYKKFNQVIKNLIEEKKILSQALKKGYCSSKRIKNIIYNSNLKVENIIDNQENDNDFIDYSEFKIKMEKEIKIFNEKTIEEYENNYILTFFYGTIFSQMSNYLKNNLIDKNEIEPYLRYITDNYNIEYYNKPYSMNMNDNIFNKIKIYINKLFEWNNISFNDIFKPHIIHKNFSNYFNQGIYFRKYIKDCEKDIVLLIFYLTKNFPLNSSVLFCKNTTSFEEVIAFFYRFLKCQYHIPFVIVNFSNLKSYIKSKIMELLKQNEETKIKSCLIFMINEIKEKEFMNYFYKSKLFIKEIPKFKKNEEKILTLEIKRLSDVEIIDSIKCGLGKTYLINQYAHDRKINLITFPFGYTDSMNEIINDLKKLQFIGKKIILLLNIYDTEYIDILQQFLFFLIFTSIINENGNIFFLRSNVKIVIEVPFGIYRFTQKCKILSLISIREIKFPEIKLSDEMKEKCQLIYTYNYMYKEKIIENYILKPYINKNGNFRDDNKQIIFYKNEENKIYIDSIKEIIGENRINYYQFFSFVNLLYTQLKHLNQNYHLNPRLINDQANLKIKNWMIQYVYELLIELVKKFFFPSEYKEINRKEIYDEYSEITEKKQISNYINILNKLSTNDFIKYIIIFNKDGQSLTIINNNNKEVNTKLKQIWNFENLSTKENLKDYNNLNSIEFKDEIKKYFNINETIKSKKINGDFVFTTDNFIKLILIDINMESNIPIILVGETGIGKTYIILEISLILNIKLKKLNIHAGINENDVINFMNKNVLNQNKTEEIWVFFDEINTSHVIHLISEMMCNRTIKGIKLNNNIKFIASCNPYRIKRGLKDIYGLENKEIKNNKINNRFLDYNVYPIPFSLLNYTIIFDGLSNEDEKKYIKAMISNYKNIILNNDLIEDIIKLVSQSQIFFKNLNRSKEEFLVSMRDVKRFCDLFKWFKNYFDESRNNSMSPIDEIKSIFLAIYINYIIRIPQINYRKELYEKIIEITSKSERLKDYNIENIINEEKDFLCNKMIIPKEIAKNEILKENIFALFTCIMSKIPILVIGKPGTSKSIGMEIIYDSLNGKLSKDEYFKKLPNLIYINFQGSINTNSNEVEEAFKKTKNLIDIYNENLIPVLFFDEIGLAESSKDNPLKVLHAELDNYYDINNNNNNDNIKKISFVGISNYSLDYSKQNRVITLNRDDLNLDDLKNTANIISKYYLKNYYFKDLDEIFCKLSEIYYEYKGNLKDEFKDFHSNRDFYNLIKQISQNIYSKPKMNFDEIIDLCFYYLKVNFSGLNKNKMEKEKINSIIYYFEKKFKSQIVLKTREFSINKAIKENIQNNDSRYILLISNSSVSKFLLDKLLNNLNRNYIFFIGSQFKDDINNKNYSYRIINKIIPNIEFGKFIIFKNLDVIYSAFYDLFNLHFHYLNDNPNKRFVRLIIGMVNIPRLFVHKNFRCAILVNEDDIFNQPIPFLNRFEKYLFSFNSLLNSEEQKICENIYNNFHSLFDIKKIQINNKDIDISKQEINFGREEIYAFFYIKKNELSGIFFGNKEKEIINNLIKIFSQNLSQDIILYSKYSKISNDFLNQIYECYKLVETKNKNLTDFLKNINTRKNIIYTFSFEYVTLMDEINIKKFNMNIKNEDIEHQYISFINSQFEIEECLENFYKGNKKILIFYFDISQTIHLNHIVSLIENEENNSSKKNEKIILIIITIKRVFLVDYNYEKQYKELIDKEQDQIKERDYVSHLVEYEQIFIDNLSGKSREVLFIDLLKSNNNIIKALNLENNLEEIINDIINKKSSSKSNNSIQIKKNTPFYNYLLNRVEKSLTNIDEPIQLFLSEKFITNNTIDLYENLINFLIEKCKIYIENILYILDSKDLISYFQNLDIESFKKKKNLIDNLIKNLKIKSLITIKNNNLFSNEKYIYKFPLFKIYIEYMTKKINDNFKAKFLLNENKIVNKIHDEEFIKNEYIIEKNNLLTQLMYESDNILNEYNVNFDDFNEEKLRDDFIIYYTRIFYNKKVINYQDNNFIPLIFKLIEKNSFKYLNRKNDKKIEFYLYSCLWLESYKNLFLIKYFQNISILNLLMTDEYNSYNEIKELIDSETIKYTNKSPEMKKLCHEILFLLNESFLCLLNKYINDSKIKLNDEFQTIYNNCYTFKNNLKLYSFELYKIEIKNLIYNYIDLNIEKILSVEKSQDNQDNIEELKNKLNEEVNELKNIELKENCKFNKISLIIKLLTIKFNIFQNHMDVKKEIIKIIFQNENIELLLSSKNIFQLIFIKSLVLNSLNNNDSIGSINDDNIILGEKDDLLEYIEKEANTDIKKLIYHLIFMDIVSKFILKHFDISSSFDIFEEYFKEICNEEDDTNENNKDLRKLFKIEYIKIYFFFISDYVLKDDDNEIKNNFIKLMNENIINDKFKLYFMKCIKFRLNNSFSNIKNQNININWIHFIEENTDKKMLYSPIKIFYVIDQEKYNNIANNKRLFELKQPFQDKTDKFSFIQFFLFEKVSLLLSKQKLNEIESNLFENNEFNISEQSKNLLNAILINENNDPLSDEDISFYILCFNVWCYFYEFYGNDFKIEENNDDNLINNFFYCLFKFVNAFIEKQNLNQIFEKLKKQFIKINSMVMKKKNIRNSYCYIYSFLLNKDKITFEKEEKKDNLIYKFINNINNNENYYEYFIHYNYERHNNLNLERKLQINEIEINRKLTDNIYLFKEYFTFDNIFTDIENRINTLFFYYDKNNQIILKKVYKLIKNICPFIKILNENSGKISKTFANKIYLKVIIEQNNLKKEFDIFRKTFIDLFKEDISEDNPLIEFLLTENKCKLIDKFKSIIDDYNEIDITSSNQLLNNQIDFFDITINDIIPPFKKEIKVCPFEIDDFLDNSERKIYYYGDNNFDFSDYSKLEFILENIIEITKQKMYNYIPKLPYPKEFIFIFGFNSEIYDLINQFEIKFKNAEILETEEKVNIKNFIKNQNYEDKSKEFRLNLQKDNINNRLNSIFTFFHNIFYFWKKQNTTKFKEYLYEEIFKICQNENDGLANLIKNKKPIISFFQKYKYNTNQIVLIYECIEEFFFKELIDNIHEDFKKDFPHEKKKKLNDYFTKLNKKEKNIIIKLLRKYILRILISNPVDSIDNELIDTLKELNKTNKNYIEILNSLKQKLESLKLELKIDNAIELYKTIKKEK